MRDALRRRYPHDRRPRARTQNRRLRTGGFPSAPQARAARGRGRGEIAMAVEYDPALIGRVFEQTDPVPVTAEMVKNFTEAIGETNPIYLDPEAAKKGPNGTVVAPPSFAVTFRNGQHFFQHVPRFRKQGFDAAKHLESIPPLKPRHAL